MRSSIYKVVYRGRFSKPGHKHRGENLEQLHLQLLLFKPFGRKILMARKPYACALCLKLSRISLGTIRHFTDAAASHLLVPPCGTIEKQVLNP